MSPCASRVLCRDELEAVVEGNIHTYLVRPFHRSVASRPRSPDGDIAVLRTHHRARAVPIHNLGEPYAVDALAKMDRELPRTTDVSAVVEVRRSLRPPWLRLELHARLVTVGELDAAPLEDVAEDRSVRLCNWRLTINALGAVNGGCCKLRTTT
jgi:hypothetical protein